MASKFVRFFFLGGILISACQPAQITAAGEQAALSNESVEQFGQSPTDTDAPVSIAEEPFAVPPLENPVPIKSENADELVHLRELLPVIPPHYAISPDGRRIAIGGIRKTEIIDASTRKTISSLNIDLPECGFGFGKYLTFNQDGSFLAVVSQKTIQVWQTGGGLIFESHYSRSSEEDNIPCGADIPQLALSPDGGTLAVSGVDYSGKSIKQYFRVVDIIANKILYEWDHTRDAMHGRLYGFPNLGFSKDGKFIQTFEPLHLNIASKKYHQAFRFWSTSDWKETESSSKQVFGSFDAGSLLVGISETGKIRVIRKTDGYTVAIIPASGCNWAFPCEIRFSPDGGKVAVLPYTSGWLNFRQSILYPVVRIWDLETGEMMSVQNGWFSNLDGVFIENTGDVKLAQEYTDLDDISDSWWVARDFFQGIQEDFQGALYFVPIVSVLLSDPECRYCGSCKLDTQESKINCFQGVTGFNGVYSVDIKDGGYVLISHTAGAEGEIGRLSIRPVIGEGEQRVRLLDYSMDAQTAFYCHDIDYRQQRCVIDLLGENRIFEEFTDISFLRVSSGGETAAFIDSSSHKLFVYDLKTQSLEAKSHYQARAVNANPVFSGDSSFLYYLVEKIKTEGDYSGEIIDVKSRRVQKRISFTNIDLGIPAALALNSGGDLWAVASQNGAFYLISPENGLIRHARVSGQSDLIGITFLQEDRLLATMDSRGIISIWGLPDQ